MPADDETHLGQPTTHASLPAEPSRSLSTNETRVVGAPPAAASAYFDTGDAFGSRYRIIKQLGAGGMGVVYQAWDEVLNVVVALKMIRPDTDPNPAPPREIERRFKRELLLARKVTHKHVVRIHDLGDVDGTKYITMSFVEGEDLVDDAEARRQAAGCRGSCTSPGRLPPVSRRRTTPASSTAT